MRTRVVLDANVFASALMKSDGAPALIIHSILRGTNYELVISQLILEELTRILFYPKVRKRIPKTDHDIISFIEALTLLANFVVPRHKYLGPLVPEDPDDDIYLITALDSKAKYLVSGDQHLLKIQEFEGIKIIKPADFLKFN